MALTKVEPIAVVEVSVDAAVTAEVFRHPRRFAGVRPGPQAGRRSVALLGRKILLAGRDVRAAGAKACPREPSA
ncbi:hypothetical protein GCM10023328_47010 [Modestobacter marinus]|uniref:Uncharacterized protein n=1 Tax=Modestobacter marinus TaxID=477641 RepID=A0ABQ2GC73_9ACTN|nr:hypothetical protein GCM10011589_46780 [Modestobacter marinus]